MKRILGAMLLLMACESNQLPSQQRERVSAATALTSRYSHSRMARWDVHGQAAGDDCGILFIDTVIIMDDSIVEAFHYGTGAYDVYSGGLRQFSRDREFRGVAYKDGTGRIWTYGDVSPSEASLLVRCH